MTARWIGVGQSDSSDTEAAAREATQRALATGSDPAKLLVVFASTSHDLEELSRTIRAEAPDVKLVGCSTAGEIATDGPGAASVVVTAFGGAFSVTTAVAREASSGLQEAGGIVAEAVHELADSPHKVLMLLTDGLGGDQEEIVRGVYRVTGASVPLVGGCAGDDMQMARTFQLHDDEVLSDAVVGVAIGSDAPFGIGVQHGWRKVGDGLVVTRSEGTRVYELDDRPALDAYLDHLDAPDEARNDPTAFTEFALTHPLGVSRRRGEEVRFIAEANFEDRSLGCIASVPEGGVAWIMEGDEDSVLEATRAATGDAIAGLDGHAPVGMLAFDCVARRGVLGDEGIKEEIDAVAGLCPGTPVAGFYTYGEIARTRGTNGFHNQTLVLLAVA